MVEQEAVFRFRLGVAREDQVTSIRG
jgi:hypothetical protein